MQLILVGIKNESGSIDKIKSFTSKTWALKYAKKNGTPENAVYAVIEPGFTSDPIELNKLVTIELADGQASTS